MKKRILAIGLGTVLTLAMLTGCGKDENLANTDFGTVTQEDIHQVAEEYHVDENVLTEIVEELTEEQKLEREVKPFVMEVIANLIPTDDNFVQDAEWIAANQVPVPWISVTKDGVKCIELDAEYYRNVLSVFAEEYPGRAMEWPNSSIGIPTAGWVRPVTIFPENWDENSLKITEIKELEDVGIILFSYNRYVQDGRIDERYQEVVPDRIVDVTMKGTEYFRNDSDIEDHTIKSTCTIDMNLVKINGTWYFTGVSFR